jgi:hypothetical protein
MKQLFSQWRYHLVRQLVSLVLFVAGVSFLPYFWCARHARDWFDGDKARQEELAKGVAHWLEEGVTRSSFDTGSQQFNGEWLFGTYMMAGMGYGQMILQHPESRDTYLPLMERCLDRLLSEDVKAFDVAMWGDDPIDSLSRDSHHAAYLGYMNLLLSLHRQIAPESRFADLNDRITATLRKRVASSAIRLIESYPGEVYPVDNCMVIGSIGLHARATGQACDAFLSSWSTYAREHYVDKETGLLYQCVFSVDGRPIDFPRGSGTALGLYGLSFADPVFARELYQAMETELDRRVFLFGVAREYPANIRGERGDIDSGPVVLGYGMSATGFLISGSRIHGDYQRYRELFATAYGWGAPYRHAGRLNFVTGGPLGDAIMFAMLTAGGKP